MHGIVEAIDYTRTLVRIDQLLPVLIPNKTLQDAVIINESRAGNSAVRNNYVGPRNLNFSFQMPYKDMDKVWVGVVACGCRDSSNVSSLTHGAWLMR